MLIEGSTYEIVFPADLSESVEVGLLLLQKPDLVVFSPRLGYCLRASTFGAVPSPDPAVFAFSVQGDRVSFEHRDGGDCAGPMKLSRVPWTRAPAARIALERLGDIRAIDAGGFLREELSLDDETRPDAWPDWSPDGSRFVYSGADREGFDLYVRNADGSGLEQITSAPGDEITPAWSPDGSRIAFVAHPDDGSGSRLMVVNADGTGAKELLATGETSAIMPVWSPDASRIAFTIREPSGSTLHVIGADGEDLERVREDAVAQAWTPDGRIVFTTSDRTMGSMLPDGSRGRSIIEGLPEPIVFPVLTLSPDGGWIVVSNGWSVIGDTEQVVYLLRADGTESFWIGYGSEPDWRPT
jgi:TolB protein